MIVNTALREASGLPIRVGMVGTSATLIVAARERGERGSGSSRRKGAPTSHDDAKPTAPSLTAGVAHNTKHAVYL